MASPIQFGETEWVDHPEQMYVGNQFIAPPKQANDISWVIPKTPRITPIASLRAHKQYDPAIIYAGTKHSYSDNQHVQEFPDWQPSMSEPAHHLDDPAIIYTGTKQGYLNTQYMQASPAPEEATQLQFHHHNLQNHSDADWQDVTFCQVSSNEDWRIAVADSTHESSLSDNEPADTDFTTQEQAYGYGYGYDYEYDYTSEEMEGGQWNCSSYTSADSISKRSRSSTLTSLSSISTLVLDTINPEEKSLPPTSALPHFSQDKSASECEEAHSVVDRGFRFRYPMHGISGSQTMEAHTYEPVSPRLFLNRRLSSPAPLGFAITEKKESRQTKVSRSGGAKKKKQKNQTKKGVRA